MHKKFHPVGPSIVGHDKVFFFTDVTSIGSFQEQAMISIIWPCLDDNLWCTLAIKRGSKSSSSGMKLCRHTALHLSVNSGTALALVRRTTILASVFTRCPSLYLSLILLRQWYLSMTDLLPPEAGSFFSALSHRNKTTHDEVFMGIQSEKCYCQEHIHGQSQSLRTHSRAVIKV